MTTSIQLPVSGANFPGGALEHTDLYENARQARDPRFDGRFFIGVLSTGIYCRPVCPVRIPKKQNVQLYATAAAASEAGYRPCLRCRPESSPGTAAWVGASWKVSRALQMIEQGFLDDGSVEELAARFQVSSRQLTRLFNDNLGASPLAVAQTRRLHFAKKLIDETELPMSEICFAAGFGSLRRFNALFQKTYGRSPRELRQRAKPLQASTSKAVKLSLSYRPPLDWAKMLSFLAYRAIPGVEVVKGNRYARTILIDGLVGHFSVEFLKEKPLLDVEIDFPNTRYLQAIVERIRGMFDLRADSEQIYRHLYQDAALRPLLKRFPGTRVPGCWDGFEVTIRAILGQQVSVKSASTLVARVAADFGRSYECQSLELAEDLSQVFPPAEKLVDAALEPLGIISQRADAIREVAQQVSSKQLLIDSSIDANGFIEQACSIKGIGPWTAQYVSLRSLDDPNAFPVADLILLRAAAAIDSEAFKNNAIERGPVAKIKAYTPKQLQKRSECWQPWRAYVVFLLWSHYQWLSEQE